MLKYIVTVTEDLLKISVMVTMMYAFLSMTYGKKGKNSQIAAVLAGNVFSIAMAVAKNVTSKIATNQWNMYIFYTAIASSVLFIIFSAFSFRKKQDQNKIAELLTLLSGGVLSADLIFYELPDVLSYPFLFNTGDKGILSVEFLLRLIGWILALILMVVLTNALYHALTGYGKAGVLLGLLDLALLVNSVRLVGMIIRIWLAKPKWLKMRSFESKDHPWAFPLVKFVSNNTLFFVIVIAAIAMVIPVLLYFRSLKVTEPFDNRAQERKLIARNRSYRRWSVAAAVCAVIGIVNLTAVKAYDNRVIELSPPEEYEIDGEEVLVPIQQLEDGHLHRFEYSVPDEGEVRWIIIKKPGAAAYGVGLDACEICGDAGYFERSGQVVCKRCDVVMNINTIGFRGGCNPIPLEYRVENGYIILQLQEIIDGQKNFK